MSMCRLRAVLVTAGTCFVAAISAWGAAADSYAPIPGVREFSGELIARPVQVEDQVAQGIAAQDAIRNHDAARARMLSLNPVQYVAQTDEYFIAVPQGRSEADLIGELVDTGLYQYVEPNWIVFPVSCPNDPLFANQWHHNANRMNSCAGWNIYTGTPETGVAICDTGVRLTHQDLQLHRLEGYNSVTHKWESQGGLISDINGHGTLTSGCAAANGNNAVGVSGVGWNLSFRMCRVTNSSDGSASLGALQEAARTAIEAGDKVASVSYSGCDSNSNLSTASYIRSLGGVLVWAAGNDGRNLSFGNRDADDLIVVGGTDQGDRRASFSAYGPFVDVVAPAVSIYSTTNNGNSSYGSASGTSFAAPLTAGLCALLFSTNQTLSGDDVEDLLKAGCDDLGSTGIDNTFGYGRIDVFNSLTLAQDYCVGNEITQQPQSQQVCVHDDVALTIAATGTSLSYQWYKDDNALSNGSGVSGATAATLTLTDVALNDEGDYTCKVTDSATGCVLTSDAATVTIDACVGVTSLVRNDAAPTGGADMAVFQRNVTHHTFDLTIDTTVYPSDWTASEFSLDVVAPALGEIWHASDETNFGPPNVNLNVPFLSGASSDTRAFDTFVSPPASPFFTQPSLAAPGGVLSTPTKIRGISGQGAEIPLAWFDTVADNGGGHFVGARLTFETFSAGTLSTDAGGQLFATITGRTSSVINASGEPFSFSLYFTGGAACVEDLNGDGQIDLLDLSILLSNFGQSGVGPEGGDLNGDSVVDLNDLSALLVVFGTACP